MNAYLHGPTNLCPTGGRHSRSLSAILRRRRRHLPPSRQVCAHTHPQTLARSHRRTRLTVAVRRTLWLRRQGTCAHGACDCGESHREAVRRAPGPEPGSRGVYTGTPGQHNSHGSTSASLLRRPDTLSEILDFLGAWASREASPFSIEPTSGCLDVVARRRWPGRLITPRPTPHQGRPD